MTKVTCAMPTGRLWALLCATCIIDNYLIHYVIIYLGYSSLICWLIRKLLSYLHKCLLPQCIDLTLWSWSCNFQALYFRILELYLIVRNSRWIPKYGSSSSTKALINNNEMLPKKLYTQLFSQRWKIIVGLLITLWMF